ncbi:MAG TPA: UvrB/UvrC motif-containing protein, partial [Terriglobales bacterium]|nr:UvrB/UvrC motif-containing protein [Terriglobales bacterium]
MLAHSIPFTPERDAEAFAKVPSAPGVFLLRGHDPAAEPYVSKSANLRRRIQRLLAPPESQSKRLNLRERCAIIDFSPTGSDFENGLLLYRTVRTAFPENYAKRLRLNMSPVIRINWENEYPRLYVTRKLAPLAGSRTEGFSPASKSVYYGPFQSRALAEKFLNDALDLFKSRRCTFDLDPDPAFPGCVYSEMKMCLAPCFKGCSDEQYIDEVRRVQKFLDTCGESLIADLEAERNRASANLEFEAAAGFHARIEKVRGVVRGCDDAIRRLDQLDALILQPSTEPDSISLFRFVNGQLLGPRIFPVQNILLSNEKSGDSSLYAQPMMAIPV